MTLAFVTVFADNSGEMQIRRRNAQLQFFSRFTAGASVGRFAKLRLEFASAGTPQTEVGLLGPLEEQNLPLMIEAVEQSRYRVGQIHA